MADDPATRIAGCTRVLSQPKLAKPLEAHVLRNRGSAHRAVGNHKEALGDLDRALAIQPRHVAAHIDRGAVLFEMREDERATAAFSVALAVAPRSPEALIGRAAARDRLGDWLGARADLDRAVGLAPKHAQVYANRAHLLLRHIGPEAAADDADRAVSLAPADPWSYEVRGLVRRTAGDHTSALSDFETLIRLNPSNPLRGLLHRAGTRIDLLDWTGAIADYTRVIDTRPDPGRAGRAQAFTGRAWAHYLAGAYEHAIADATDAIAVEPDEPAAYDTRGHSRLVRGDLPGALGDFDQAIARDPAMAGAYLGRAKVRIAQTQLLAATTDLEWAVALPAVNAAQQEISSSALRLLIEIRERAGGTVIAPTTIRHNDSAQPRGPATRVAPDAPVWSIATGPGECRLSAAWPDRTIVLFAREGLIGPSPGLQIAISLQSTAWRAPPVGDGDGVAPVAAPVTFTIGTSAGRLAMAVADHSGVRQTPSKGAEINIGPLDISHWREPLTKARNVLVALDGVEIVYPASDLWAWLPAFESCAMALSREARTK